MIHIDNTYAIDADQFSVNILKKRVWGDKSKKKGDVEWQPIAYMPSMETAYKKLIDLVVMSDGLDSFGHIIERIESLKKNITERLSASCDGLQGKVNSVGRVNDKNKPCSECWCYENDPIIREYPNTDNVFSGWRTCYFGCTIKKDSVHGCFTTQKPNLTSKYQIALRKGFESESKAA